MTRPRTSALFVVAMATSMLAALVPASPAMGSVLAEPSPRFDAGMAYDAVNGEVVLFGGCCGVAAHELGDTWTWDGTQWIDRVPAHSPSARRGMGLTYDAARGEVVLFGGGEGKKRFGDTWTWDGTDWRKRTPAHAPSPRTGRFIAYDAAHGQVVLFGGTGPGGVVLGETWTWDGTDWTQRSPQHAPSPRYAFGMADDTAHDQVVLFGGTTGTEDFGDTWTWDGADWTQRSPAHSPSPRFSVGLADDQAHGGVVLFGGFARVPFQPLGDTWTWNGADWSRRRAQHDPERRYGHAMTYDAALGGVVLFGGFTGNAYFGDTWTWDGADWTGPAPMLRP